MARTTTSSATTTPQATSRGNTSWDSRERKAARSSQAIRTRAQVNNYGVNVRGRNSGKSTLSQHCVRAWGVIGAALACGGPTGPFSGLLARELQMGEGVHRHGVAKLLVSHAEYSLRLAAPVDRPCEPTA